MAIKIDMQKIEYERLRSVLNRLKDLAFMTCASEYAEDYTQEIIDVLLELEI
mgnify:CR=1 FL=1